MKKNLFIPILAILFISTVRAQSPGGVDGAGTNQMWLDANQLSLSNGNPVSSWTDQSGNGNNATITSTRRPIYSTNQINGKPSVVFDGVNDYLQTGAIAAMNVGNISYFVVFDGSLPNTIGVLLGGSYMEHAQFLLSYRTSSIIRSWIIKLPNSTKGSATGLDASYQILGSTWSSTTGLVNSYKNGTSFGSVGGATDTPSGNKYFRIGANSSGSGSYYFNGGIAEIILYSKTLNSAERNIVTNYLGAKYNLTISNDFYSYQATHGNDLIGVGQEADGSNTSARGVSIISLSNPSTLANGEYVMIGHDNVAYTPSNTSDVPTPGNERFDRVWRVDIQGATETVDLSFDLTTYSLGDPSGYVLLVDGDGVFSAGATEYVGVYDVPTQSVLFSGVSLTAGQYITLMNTSNAITSTGVTTDWHTNSTWSCGCVPALGSNVTILAGHTVNINGTDASAGSLTIDATGSLTFGGSDTLTLDGNLTNNGTITAGSGKFKFSSTAAQTIAGTQTFKHLTINNSVGVSVISGSTSIQGYLDVTLGTLTTGGLVTMLSNSSGTAAIQNPAAGIIVGDLTVQRYVNEVDKWYVIASPLTNATIEDWNQEFEMQGFPGTENPIAWPSVYYYDETAIVSDWNDGYTAPSSTADVATNGVGFDAYIANDGIATGPRSINLTGTPSLGDGITVNGTNSNTLPNPDENGWNLIGNPYASPITWGKVSKTNVIAGYRKGSTGSFSALNNGTSIASGEAFWVQINVGGGSVTFDANDVATAIADTYNQRQTQSFTDGDVSFFNVKLRFDSGAEDLIEIGFAPNATNELDLGLDAIKLNSSNLYDPNLSVEINNRHYARNIFNVDSDNLEIPLNIFTKIPTSTVDNYELVVEGIEGLLNANMHFQLEDRLLGEFYDITGSSTFSFEMSDTVSATRFYLHANKPISIITKNDVSCTGVSDGKIVVQANGVGNQTFIWKDNGGNIVKTTNNSSTTDYLENLNGGYYTLEILNNGSFGNTTYKFEIKEPEQLVSLFNVNEENNIQQWAYSSIDDTLFTETNKTILFYNESIASNSSSWDFGNGITSSMQNPQHIYFNTGLYKVNLISKNGSCESESYKYIQVDGATSISQTNLLDEVNVIVNKNDIFVYMNNQNNSGNVKFEVLNTVGQVVYSSTKAVNNNHIEKIRIDEAAGLYFLNIEGFNYSKTKKIVLN